MGKTQPLDELLRELAIYEASVNSWEGAVAPPLPGLPLQIPTLIVTH
jgi:hypothetical protein